MVRSRFTIQGNLNDGDKITVTAKDPAGNVSGQAEVTVDTVAPTLAISDNVDGIVGKGGLVTFTFTFSEAVHGFDASDIILTGGVVGKFTQVNAHVYTLEVTPNANFEGQISLHVAAGAAHDVSGNPTAAADATQAVDTLAPSAVASPERYEADGRRG